MAIAGDPKVLGLLASHTKHPLRPALSSSKPLRLRMRWGSGKAVYIEPSPDPQWQEPCALDAIVYLSGHSACHACRGKLQFGGFSTGGSNNLSITPKWQHMGPQYHDTLHKYHQCFAITGNKLSSTTVNQDLEGLLVDAINMSFFERLSLAWRILFPTPTARSNSNAKIAKQRLKMILFSDRCAVSDEAKQKIVSNIIEALSEFVEIDSQDKVQLNVSTDPDLGTVYSVTVPVRRVKPGYHDSDEDYNGKITSIEYKDMGETSGTVDVRFDFFVPGN